MSPKRSNNVLLYEFKLTFFTTFSIGNLNFLLMPHYKHFYYIYWKLTFMVFQHQLSAYFQRILESLTRRRFMEQIYLFNVFKYCCRELLHVVKYLKPVIFMRSLVFNLNSWIALKVNSIFSVIDRQHKY